MSSSQTTPTYIIPSPAAPNWRTPLLIGVLVLLAATNIFLFVQLDHLKTENRTEMTRMHDDLNATIQRIQMASSEQLQRSRRTLETQRSELLVRQRLMRRIEWQRCKRN
jgi:hypothetical protein